MRPITKSEQSLMIGLAAALFFVANLFGITFLFANKKALKADLFQLQSQQSVDTVLLKEKEMWLKRKEWIDKHQPKFQEITKTLPAIQDILKTSADSARVTLNLESSFPTPDVKTHTVTLPVQATGSDQALIRWLNDLQKPKFFLGVTSIILKANESDSSQKPSKGIVCENLKVTRYYQP